MTQHISTNCCHNCKTRIFHRIVIFKLFYHSKYLLYWRLNGSNLNETSEGSVRLLVFRLVVFQSIGLELINLFIKLAFVHIKLNRLYYDS